MREVHPPHAFFNVPEAHGDAGFDKKLYKLGTNIPKYIFRCHKSKDKSLRFTFAMNILQSSFIPKTK